VIKVGDLVRVRMAHRAPKNGIVIKIHADDCNSIVVVRPQDSSRDIYCDPLDVRVLNANR
jgi:outer membrane lipoprotein SlyB